MVKSQARRFVPASYRAKLAQAFINVSCTRSSARSGCPANDMAKARNDGIAASNSALSELFASLNVRLLRRLRRLRRRPILHRRGGLIELVEKEQKPLRNRLTEDFVVSCRESTTDLLLNVRRQRINAVHVRGRWFYVGRGGRSHFRNILFIGFRFVLPLHISLHALPQHTEPASDDSVPT